MRKPIVGLRSILCLVVGAFAPGTGNAAFLLTVNSTNNNANPIHAQALFDFGNGTLTVTIQNLVVNPSAINQNISGLNFSIQGLGSPLILTSSSGLERFVSGPAYTNGSIGATGWGLQAGQSTGYSFINAMGFVGPMHTLIGEPGVGGYTAAGSSITSGPHNTVLAGPIVFNFTNPELTPSSQLASNFVQFGTDKTNRFVGTITAVQGPELTAAPAPESMLLLAQGLALTTGYGLWRRRQAIRHPIGAVS